MPLQLAGGGHLLKGAPYDEEAQRADFAAAVAAWRSAAPSGRTKASHTVTDGMQTNSIDHTAPKVEITFGQTSELSYLEHLMLKRHQKQQPEAERAWSSAQERATDEDPNERAAAITLQAAFRGACVRREMAGWRQVQEELKTQKAAVVALVASSLHSVPVVRRKHAPLPIPGQSQRICELTESVKPNFHPLTISMSLMHDFETMERQQMELEPACQLSPRPFFDPELLVEQPEQ